MTDPKPTWATDQSWSALIDTASQFYGMYKRLIADGATALEAMSLVQIMIHEAFEAGRGKA